MANANIPSGAKIAWHLMNSHPALRPYTVPATDATALFVNDLVKLSGTAAIGDDGYIHPVVTQAAATDTIVGVVVGFLPSNVYPSQIYRTASTQRVAYVCIDPNIVLEMQCSGTLGVADIGLNADIIVGSGSVITGVSAMEVDLSTKATATFQLRIIDLVQRPDNEYGADAKVYCMINEHRYKTAVGV